MRDGPADALPAMAVFPSTRMTSLKRSLAWTLAIVLGVLLLAGAALAIFVATFDANRYKPQAVEWMRTHYDRELAIDGPLALRIWPRLALSAQGVRLSGAGRTGDFAAVAGADVALELLPLLRGEVRAGRVSVHGVRLSYLRDAQGRSNVDDLLAPAATEPAAAPGTAPSGPVAIDVAGVDLRDAVLHVKDDLGGVAGTLTLQRLQAGRIAPGVQTPVELQLALDLSQPAIRGDLSGRTQLSLAAQPARGGAPAATVVTLGESSLSFKGTAADVQVARAEIGLAGTAYAADSHTTTVQGLRLALEAALPGLGAQTLELQGSAAASPRRADWQLQGRWRAPGNDGPISTSGRYAIDTGTIDARAELQSLDLDALRAAPAAAASAAPAPAAPAAGSPAAASGDAAPVDLRPATLLKGTVQAKLGTLVASGIRFSDMAVTLRGDGRALDAAPFSARVWNGRIEGRARAEAAASRLTLAATASDIRIEQAMADLSGRDTVRGTGRLELDLNTRGQTVGQLKSQLAGRAAVQLRDGAVKGFNLAELGRKAKAALALKKDDYEKASATAQTDFSEIAMSFAIAQGIARSSDLAAKSPYLRVGGEGQIDIPRSAIDYTAFVTVTDTSKGQGGAELAALDGIRLPVRLTGPLDAMQYQVQWSAVGGAIAKEAVKQKLEEKLGLDSQEKKDALKEKAREKLKGLFR